MEYCSFPNLEWLNLNRDDIPKVIYKMAEAIKFMHSKGICHRDLKPDNILVDYTDKYFKLIKYLLPLLKEILKLKLLILVYQRNFYLKVNQINRIK